MGIKQSVARTIMRYAIDYVGKNPERNLPRLFDYARKHFYNEPTKGMWREMGKVLHDPTNNWFRFAMSLWNDIDRDVLKTTMCSLIVQTVATGLPKQTKNAKKYDCNVPIAILMDPTSACNLKCKGCWAADYGNKLSMSYETMDDIIKQGKKLGSYLYIFSGGEPLIRKDDIIKLCHEHCECAFLAFTNGTLIDEAFANEMLRVGNFVPAISVEGDEESTDFRRGKGTFAKCMKAMRILRDKRLPFGISTCYTSKNTDLIGSEEYFDQMIEWGAKFCWFFTYMPIGKDAPTELMVSEEQRKFMYQQVRKFRSTKALFTLDFWNDGEYSEGCIAGGKRYLHINANGDVEPCAFIHYSDSSVYKKTLLEALKSPLFMAYRKGQPFNDNPLRPCPLLDNPDALVNAVRTSGAVSTDMQSPEDVAELAAKCKETAANWAGTADRLWACSGKCKNCNGCGGFYARSGNDEIKAAGQSEVREEENNIINKNNIIKEESGTIEENIVEENIIKENIIIKEKETKEENNIIIEEIVIDEENIETKLEYSAVKDVRMAEEGKG